MGCQTVAFPSIEQIVDIYLSTQGFLCVLNSTLYTAEKLNGVYTSHLLKFLI